MKDPQSIYRPPERAENMRSLQQTRSSSTSSLSLSLSLSTKRQGLFTSFRSKSWHMRYKKSIETFDHEDINVHMKERQRSKSSGGINKEWKQFIFGKFRNNNHNCEKENIQPSSIDTDQSKEQKQNHHHHQHQLKQLMTNRKYIKSLGDNNGVVEVLPSPVSICSQSEASIHTIQVSNRNINSTGLENPKALSSLLMEQHQLEQQKDEKGSFRLGKMLKKMTLTTTHDRDEKMIRDRKPQNQKILLPPVSEVTSAKNPSAFSTQNNPSCRLDGLYCLSLGLAESILSAPVIVLNTLYDTSPSMVLEGFLSSGEDRFIVHITSPPPTIDKLQNTTRHGIAQDNGTNESSRYGYPYNNSNCNRRRDKHTHNGGFDGEVDNQEETEHDVDRLPLNLHLWGSDNAPPLCYNQKDKSGGCPIDIDDDLFIIDNLDHLSAVHNTAIDALENGRFDEALEVFQKIFYSHKAKHGLYHYLVGSALHNIGVINLWAGRFHDSYLSFKAALRVRTKVLLPGHPVLSVTLASCGMALFGRGKFSEACRVFGHAYRIKLHSARRLKSKYPNNNSNDNRNKESESSWHYKERQQINMDRGKFLNNLGCAQFKAGNLKSSHKSFTRAFEVFHDCLNHGTIKSTKTMTSVKTSSALLSLGRLRISIVSNATTSLCNIGQVYIRRHESEKAVYVYEEALKLQSTVYGPKNPLVQIILKYIDFAKQNKEKKLGTC